MPRIHTMYDPPVYAGQKFTQPSETRPDESMSLRDMLTKYANGQPLVGDGRDPVFYGETPPIPDWDKMDLVDRENLLLAKKEEVRALTQRIQRDSISLRKQRQKDEEEARRQAIDEAVKAARESMNPKP